MRKFIEHRLIHVKVLTFCQGVALEEAPIWPMSSAQADAAMARLSFMLGWSKETPALAAAALKENSKDAAVRALSARIAAHDGPQQDITDLANLLAGGGTDDAQLRIDVAATLLAAVPSQEAAAQAFSILDGLVHSEAAPLEAIGL